MREQSDDAVRVWRPADQERLLLMRGRTSSYAVDPRGEYCIGVVTAEPMRVTRGRARHVVRPGELHAALTSAASTLERDARLAAWLRALAARSSAPPRAQRAVRRARRDPALRAACELLASEPARNVTLDELAAAAGIGRYRLLRLFRAGLGVPPHRYQLACRIARARTLLAGARPIAEVALETGFADQSHLHRHFRRSLGLTPARYGAAVARGRA